MKLKDVNSTISDAVKALRKMELPEGANAYLTSVVSANNVLPDIAESFDTREKENKQLRDAAKAGEQERADLKDKLPSDDARKELERLRKLEADLEGMTPQQAKEHRDWKQNREKADQRNEAWRLAGYDPEVARSLSGVDALEYRLESVRDAAGKDVKKPEVKADNRWIPLVQYVENAYKPFLDVLKGSSVNVVGQDGRNPSAKAEDTSKKERDRAFS